MPGGTIPIHLLLGQPASGKDSRLALIAEETGADMFRFGAIFDRYPSALPVPTEAREKERFFAEYETDGTLANDDELLRRLATAGCLPGLDKSQKLWAFKIAYFGGFKTGLIPDSVVDTIFDEELTAHLRTARPESIVLNSYPKTLGQYTHLCHLFGTGSSVPLTKGVVFLMEFTEWNVLESRTAKRLVCNNCDSVYAATELQATPDGAYTCRCGNALKQRLDTHIFDKRRDAYLRHTAPMITRVMQEWGTYSILSGRAYSDPILGRSEIQTAIRTWRNAS